jgi:hypothetical protein
MQQGPPQQGMYMGGITQMASGGMTMSVPVDGRLMEISYAGYPSQQAALEAFFSGENEPLNLSGDPTSSALGQGLTDVRFDQDGNLLPTNIDMPVLPDSSMGAAPASSRMDNAGAVSSGGIGSLAALAEGAAPETSQYMWDAGPAAGSAAETGSDSSPKTGGKGLFSSNPYEPAFRALEDNPEFAGAFSGPNKITGRDVAESAGARIDKFANDPDAALRQAQLIESTGSGPRSDEASGIAALKYLADRDYEGVDSMEDTWDYRDTWSALQKSPSELMEPNASVQGKIQRDEAATVAEELVTEDPIEAIAAVADSTSSDKYSSGPGGVEVKGTSDRQRQAVKRTGDATDTSGIASLIGMGGQKAADVPDISDLIKAQHQAGWSNALMQLGAGIAGNDLSGGLSKAGTAMSAGSKAARDLDLRGRMAQYSAEQKQIDRDIDIYDKVGTLEVAEARALIDQKIQNQRGDNEVLRFAQNLINQSLAGVFVSGEEKAKLAMQYARAILPADLAAKFGAGLTEETLGGGGDGSGRPPLADFKK